MVSRGDGERRSAGYYDSGRQLGVDAKRPNSIETPGVGGGAGASRALESAPRFSVGGSADTVFERRTSEERSRAVNEELDLQKLIEGLEKKEQELLRTYNDAWRRIDPRQRFRSESRGVPVPFEELNEYDRFQHGFATQKKKWFGRGFEYIDTPGPTEQDRQEFEVYNRQMESYGQERRLAKNRLESLVAAREYEKFVADFDKPEKLHSRAKTAAEFQQLIGGTLRFSPEDVIVIPGDGGSNFSEQNGEKILTYFIPQEGKYSPQSDGIGGVKGPAGQFRGPQKLVLERTNADGSKEQFLYVHDATRGKWKQQDYGSQKMPVPKLKAKVIIRDGVVEKAEVY
jgi:hypothetical protein